MFSGDDLTIVLFLVGTAISLVCAAMSTAGWRHQALIFGLFAMAAICFAGGVGWPFIKNISPPALTGPIRDIATNPVSWFVVMMLAVLAAVMLPKRREDRTNTFNFQLQPDSAISTIETVKATEPLVIDQVVVQKSLSEPRIYTNLTPAELTRLFHDRTAIQAKALLSPYIGKWIRVTSQVKNVFGEVDSGLALLQVCAEATTSYCKLFIKEIDHLALRRRTVAPMLLVQECAKDMETEVPGKQRASYLNLCESMVQLLG